MAKKIDIPIDRNIVLVPIDEAMPDNYLPYAVEVAKDRALPDVRDGLKPVHRRILYGAYLLKAFPDKPYFKSARIVGDILGKFHPHGDSSVYDSMVILAQDFSTRKPLIDGHGNWGSMDGDNAAAMRYTEARLTPLALELLRDIDKDVVDMVDNYSNSEIEPKVLPARYPNLLVNGVFGIAVGLATNIPPHNLGEVIDGTLAYIENNNIDTKGLMEYIKGPDLPTGGTIIGKESLVSAYETGNGKVTVRAKTEIEVLENGRIGIVITEFPYKKNKARILQTISEMTGDKKHAKALEGIIDIRDESDRTGIRSVIELKKSINMDGAEKVLKYLLKKTELQNNISFNMVAIANGKPETLSLKAILVYYVDHQKEVVTRRTKRELQIAERRFHIIEGFIKAIDVLDEVIKTIRGSKSKSNAEENLISKFEFSKLQAEAILELMLYRLTGLEIKTFEKEYKELEKIILKLRKILSDEKELLKVIKDELKEIKDKYNDPRRTVIIENDDEAKIDIEELIIIEDVVLTLSSEGYIKRIPIKNYSRTTIKPLDIEYREGDYLKDTILTNTAENLIVFTNKGNLYNLKINDIPEERWKEKGVRLDSLSRGMNLDEEFIVKAVPIRNFNESKNIVLITSFGGYKKTALCKFISAYSKIAALKLKSDEELISVNVFESEREESFLKIETDELAFTIEEPKLSESERTNAPTSLVSLPENDLIKKVSFSENFEYKTFIFVISENGELKVKGETKADGLKGKCFNVMTSSSSEILLFDSKGNILKISAMLFQNTENIINLKDKYPTFMNKVDKIVGVISIESFEISESIYFFTKKGFVKRTSLNEFNGEYRVTQGYKLKTDEDRIIGVSLCKNINEDSIVLVTEKGMAIKAEASSINEMGKIASGVIGISLKDEDSVIYGKIINEDGVLKLISHLKEKLIVKSKDLPIQNRGGRGKLILQGVLGDYIVKVDEK